MEWKVESNVETVRGNDCLIIRSEEGRFKYSKVRALQTGETRYRCTNRKCNMNVFVTATGKVTRASMTSHSHPPIKSSQLTLARLSSALKQYTRENIGSKTPDEIIQQAYEIGAYSIPPSKTKILKKALHVARRHVMKETEAYNAKQDNRKVSTDEPILIEEDSSITSLKKVYQKQGVPEIQLSTSLHRQINRRTSGESVIGRGEVARTSGDATHTQVLLQSPGAFIAQSQGEVGVSGTRQVSFRKKIPALISQQNVSSSVVIKGELDIPYEPSNGDWDGDSFAIKGEASDGESSSSDSVMIIDSPGYEDLIISRETQTDEDDDLRYLLGIYPLMKKLKPSDKTMVKAQIQQLFRWKLKETP